MRTWLEDEIGQRFGEVLDACSREGAQLVSRHGKEPAVVVSLDEWRRLTEQQALPLAAWLVDDRDRTDLHIPPRGQGRRRDFPTFND